MNIITGTTGTPHVTSQQQREINMAVFGKGNVVFNIGKRFAASIGSNSVTISDGCLSMQGCCASIPAGATENVVIENGSQGTGRIDIVCAVYKNNSGIESVELGVIKGEASASPNAPEIPSSEIREGAATAYMPLYQVEIDNTSVLRITQIFELYQEQKLLWSGAAFMMENQVVNLTEPISAQNEGIELIFAPFDADSRKILEGAKCIIRLSKRAIEFLNGESANFFMTGSSNFYHERIAAKTLKFTDTTIIGSAHNELSGTGSSGIKFNNRSFVLCAVIGV